MEEFYSWNKTLDVPGAEGFLVCNQQLSMTQVLRAVKRKEHGLFNCIASIVFDSIFVSKVQSNFDLPLLGNLRCGVWYAKGEDAYASCYFKSTDGHTGQWSFSLTRLNLHVVEIAIDHGGVCIVDATRRGKSFPVCILTVLSVLVLVTTIFTVAGRGRNT